MQEEIGLEVVTDGEFRRGSYWGRFVERTEGLEVRSALLSFATTTATRSTSPRPTRVAPLRRTRPLALDEFVFLRDATTVTAKVTRRRRRPCISCASLILPTRGAYSDVDRFFADLVAVFAPGDRRPGTGRMPLHPDRRDRRCAPVRRRHPRARGGGGRRSRCPGRPLRRCPQWRRRRLVHPRTRHRRSYVSRQFQGALSRRGRI